MQVAGDRLKATVVIACATLVVLGGILSSPKTSDRTAFATSIKRSTSDTVRPRPILFSESDSVEAYLVLT
jgi:hypothetical protein